MDFYCMQNGKHDSACNAIAEVSQCFTMVCECVIHTIVYYVIDVYYLFVDSWIILKIDVLIAVTAELNYASCIL